MIVPLLRLLGRLPLAWLHGLGATLGWIVYLASPVYAARLRGNLTSSNIFPEVAGQERAVRSNIAETGKAVLEIAKVWFDDEARVAALVRCDRWAAIEDALHRGRGIIFVTPHLGCFEIAAFYVARQIPLTVLYRPPRQRWLEPLMIRGRTRASARVAPASLRGVRMLYKALQRGEAIGLLPDQAPQAGEGAWADFFGRPAYTMTLVSRLHRQTEATVIFAFAERLPHGRGYQLHFEPYAGTALTEGELNRAVEAMIRQCPTQYLWSYNRYKTPKGASTPSTSNDPAAPAARSPRTE